MRRIGGHADGRITRRSALGFLASGLLAARPALADGSGWRTIPGLYAVDPAVGLALNGFDPVSYFLPGATAPEGGRAGIELRLAGVDWRFASAANREAFRRAPETYLPRLGGFDVPGIVAGVLAESDPLAFLIAGERLYLFRGEAQRARADAAMLAAAEARWPALQAAPE